MITKIKATSIENVYTATINGVEWSGIHKDSKEYPELLEAIAGGTEDYPTPIAVEPEFTDAELLQQEQTVFRAERDILLVEADIEINKLVDNNLDASAWRTYRQQLRDAPETWVMPTRPAQ